MRRSKLALGVLVVLSFAACSGGGTAPGAKPPQSKPYDPSGTVYNHSKSPECIADPAGCQALLSKPVHSVESFAELRELIDRKSIHSVDQLLGELPEDFLNGYSLIYRSHALKQALATPTTPRVLLYGVSANLMLTYNGNPIPGETETVETLEFRPDESRYVLREVPLDGKNPPDWSQVQENPAKCLDCHALSHTQEAKAIWKQYNIWPGVYGSLSRRGFDFVNVRSPEYADYQAFLAAKGGNPRYAALKVNPEYLNASGAPKLLREFDRFKGALDPAKLDDGMVFGNGNSTLANQTLSMATLKQNFQRLARMLMSMPVEKRQAYQYLVKGLSKGLDPDQVDNTQRDQFNQWAVYSPKPDDPATLVNFLKPAVCGDRIDGFFPDGAASKPLPLAELLGELRGTANRDYLAIKTNLGGDNLGLTRANQVPDPADPFDLKTSAYLTFDPINTLASVDVYGYRDAAYLSYALQALGLDTRELATTTDFDRADGQVVGRYQLLAGNTLDCFPGRGELKLMQCFYGDVSVFFDKFLPRQFYSDPAIHKMGCDELAQKSRAALSAYLKTSRISP